ncbi:hypothetical protein AZ66_25625 [Paenibacillus sp. E194]|uniref:hypothetical protein n=1 Tax=Paenibacillus sp. E194 TaxID=1458845 RepID=UPI0005CB2DE9|nr:hypothetical protein [Paenibacillus sp. E194]KJB85285.1 hypothetical protein AZ66_25625 [Paenibacillus sp. E194]
MVIEDHVISAAGVLVCAFVHGVLRTWIFEVCWYGAYPQASDIRKKMRDSPLVRKKYAHADSKEMKVRVMQTSL